MAKRKLHDFELFSLSTKTGFRSYFLTIDRTSQCRDSKIPGWLFKAEHGFCLSCCIFGVEIRNLCEASGLLRTNGGGYQPEIPKEKAGKSAAEVVYPA